MNFYVYILYSLQLDRYYSGTTVLEVNERLKRHLSDYYGDSKFTHKAKDWILFHEIECDSLEQARKIEAHIKRMKSKRYIENLKKYPEIAQELMNRYKEIQD